MDVDDTTRAALADAFESFCPAPDGLQIPDGYRDSGLAVVDAVFSIQARYEGVTRVVSSYAEWADLTEIAPLPVERDAPDHHDVSMLANRLSAVSGEAAANDVFDNRSGTHRLKAELVIDAAQALVAAGVRRRQDVALTPNDETYETQKLAWTSVDGLGPVTFEYFRMLCGAESSKPDVMVIAWLHEVLGQDFGWRDALDLMSALRDELTRRWGVDVSLRAVDHTVWRHQSGRA
ncbi:hypothetical protein [Egicoccus halophilus]|uniref:Heme peroxidase n=1 Tax=Egicoccus halophilus TaxID=1670830 RepID=A0A8J3A9T8_9ACTN|nr:hypothetical protein [Egicoccus halophilus]GGI07892.1 heme peroxidase [Egicoccus halophilus]